MIQDAELAGLLPKPPLETRLAAVIETATSTYLGAVDDEDRATAQLYVRKAAQAADEALQQTVEGQCQTSNTSAPHLKMKTARTWTAQHPGRADSVRRSPKRSFHGEPIGLDSGV